MPHTVLSKQVGLYYTYVHTTRNMQCLSTTIVRIGRGADTKGKRELLGGNSTH